MTWTTHIDAEKTILKSKREGIDFKIELPHFGTPMAFADNNSGMACKDVGILLKWCEDFEYCYECHKDIVHADKLCASCYFK